MNINEYIPRREGKHSIFVSEENGAKHIGNNKSAHYIKQYKLDGEVFPKNTQELRCDYLLLNEVLKTSYYIELKGSNIDHAIEQIEASIAAIKDSIPEYKNIKRRIIYSSRTSRIHNSSVLKWKGKHPEAVIISNVYAETIS